jgi:hypothetical protein
MDVCESEFHVLIRGRKAIEVKEKSYLYWEMNCGGVLNVPNHERSKSKPSRSLPVKIPHTYSLSQIGLPARTHHLTNVAYRSHILDSNPYRAFKTKQPFRQLREPENRTERAGF